MEISDLQRLRRTINQLLEIDDRNWELIAHNISYVNLKKGEKWIVEGKKENRIGFILDGNMRHYYTRDGEEKTTYFYFADHLVSAYFSALTNAPSKMSIQALTDCKLITFPYSLLTSLFDESKVWERFGRKLAEYLAIGLEERMVDLLVLSPKDRYLQLIQGNKRKIVEQIPQHYIADYLGVSPVSLSRIRKRIFSQR
ncbi:Crp/Fnr family transcriptional regulator [Sphingobacterium corticis]|uniref:Crp/Fnr family transcriptional regulator n=1 Tax=Sphingobacterium corticis TaxID=1812823 RepID=A0ABW5NJ26_9SPHI